MGLCKGGLSTFTYNRSPLKFTSSPYVLFDFNQKRHIYLLGDFPILFYKSWDIKISLVQSKWDSLSPIDSKQDHLCLAELQSDFNFKQNE